jgi:hypothetical protein
MHTTQPAFWEKRGFSRSNAAALAANVQRYVHDTLGEDDQERFDYRERYAADYETAYIAWAKQKGILTPPPDTGSGQFL